MAADKGACGHLTIWVPFPGSTWTGAHKLSSNLHTRVRENQRLSTEALPKDTCILMRPTQTTIMSLQLRIVLASKKCTRHLALCLTFRNTVVIHKWDSSLNYSTGGFDHWTSQSLRIKNCMWRLQLLPLLWDWSPERKTFSRSPAIESAIDQTNGPFTSISYLENYPWKLTRLGDKSRKIEQQQ